MNVSRGLFRVWVIYAVISFSFCAKELAVIYYGFYMHQPVRINATDIAIPAVSKGYKVDAKASQVDDWVAPAEQTKQNQEMMTENQDLFADVPYIWTGAWQNLWQIGILAPALVLGFGVSVRWALMGFAAPKTNSK